MTPAPRIAWKLLPRQIFITGAAVILFSVTARAVYEFEPGSGNFFGATQVPSHAITPNATSTEFLYEFNDPGILHESDSPDSSSSPYWWVDSGGKLIVENGIGKTLHGELPASDAWRARYQRTSPHDTDDGAHPQNLFRLLTRSPWDNVRVEASFRIMADNFSESPNRDESNGILLMSRYQENGATTYYAGLRVDGHAVIKKKLHGTYTTLAEKQVYRGAYSRAARTNLLPHGEWITLASETRTTGGTVVLTLFQKAENGGWRELLATTDTKHLLTGSYPVGLRTDFMDVEFDNFKAEKI